MEVGDNPSGKQAAASIGEEPQFYAFISYRYASLDQAYAIYGLPYAGPAAATGIHRLPLEGPRTRTRAGNRGAREPGTTKLYDRTKERLGIALSQKASFRYYSNSDTTLLRRNSPPCCPTGLSPH